MKLESIKFLANRSLCDERIYLRFKDGRFGEEPLLLIGGAITTDERFENFDDSLCHLMEDGRIVCHGKQIGTAEDLEILD